MTWPRQRQRVAALMLLAVSCASSPVVRANPEFGCCEEMGVTEATAMVLTPNMSGPRLESVRLDDSNLVIEASPDRGLDSATFVRITITYESTPELVAAEVFDIDDREAYEKPLADLVPTRIRLQDWSLDGPISGRVESRNTSFPWTFWITSDQIAAAAT